MAIKSKAGERPSVARSMTDFMAQLEAGIKIDENALEDALQAQPELFYHVAKELALQISKRDQAKQRLAEVEAKIELDIRRKASDEDRKITDKTVAAEVTTDEDVIEASRDFFKLSGIVGQLGALKDAYIQRSYVLKDMTALYIQNYYGQAGGNPQNAIRDHKADTVKEIIRNQNRNSRERQ